MASFVCTLSQVALSFHCWRSQRYEFSL